MVGADLKLYGDRRSQPCRAVFVFCRINNIDFEEITVNLAEGGTKTSEFEELFHYGGIPAMADGGFRLNESHTILRYLATTRNVPDHWFPQDPKRRARIDRILDWHHNNIRGTATPLVVHRVFAKYFVPSSCNNCFPQASEEVASNSEKSLKQSLDILEKYMLQPDGKFLDGADEVSIADLSLVCELSQLECLPKETQKDLFGSRGRVRAWMDAVASATNPHFDNVYAPVRESLIKVCQEVHAMKGEKVLVDSPMYKIE